MEHINKALRSVSYAFPMLVQKYFFSRVEMIIFCIKFYKALLQNTYVYKDTGYFLPEKYYCKLFHNFSAAATVSSISAYVYCANLPPNKTFSCCWDSL